MKIFTTVSIMTDMGLGVESNWNSFEIRSIRFENLQFDDSKEQKILEKFDENQFEFDSFDSTPTIGWS